MRTVQLSVLKAQIQARKVALGMDDSPSDIEALRNKGAGRTPAKRELLRRVEERAKRAGKAPIISHY